jgi:small-conductance mechanosensitive channel
MGALRERVAATNAHYDRIVLPRPEELKPARQAELDDRQRRIAEAQRALDDDVAQGPKGLSAASRAAILAVGNVRHTGRARFR